MEWRRLYEKLEDVTFMARRGVWQTLENKLRRRTIAAGAVDMGEVGLEICDVPLEDDDAQKIRASEKWNFSEQAKEGGAGAMGDECLEATSGKEGPNRW